MRPVAGREPSTSLDHDHRSAPRPDSPADDGQSAEADAPLPRGARRSAPVPGTAAEPHVPRRGRLADPDYRAHRMAEQEARQQAAMERARDWARRTGQPMRMETNGVTLVLVDYTDEHGPIYRTTRNVTAAMSTATDVLHNHPYLLDGAGWTAGIWDGGSVRTSHTEFVTERVTNMEPDEPVNWHATHVAGTMIARGAFEDARGMAPAGQLEAYDFHSDLAEMTARAMAAPDEDDQFQVSNHSYGFRAGWDGSWWYGTWTPGVQESDYFGPYSSWDADYDQLLYEAPYYLPFFAAGNDRNDTAPAPGQPFSYWSGGGWQSTTYDPAIHPFDDGWKQGGYNTVTFGSTAKNIMLVGAVDAALADGLRDPGAAAMSPFSAWGPTDDGRIKPDVVAVGVDVLSSHSQSDLAYAWSSGTSMAAPNASGSALLLLERYDQLFPGQRMWSSTLRGLIIHTADSLEGTGPNYRHGWGLINAQAAADHLTAHAADPTAHHLVEAVITPDDPEHEFPVFWPGEDPITATLAWTDPPGPDGWWGLNITNTVLVNDLDLRLVGPDGHIHEPWILDPEDPAAPATTGDNIRDNVEQVWIAEPTDTGVYTVRVQFKGDLYDGQQHYSLLISGAESVELNVVHEPLLNLHTNQFPITLTAQIDPPELVDLDASGLWWNTTGDEEAFDRIAWEPAGNAWFTAEIPPQPEGTRIYYYLDLVSILGTSYLLPAGAPAELHAFDITTEVDLTVTGIPEPLGTVEPDYGLTTWAAGNTIIAVAEETTPPTDGQRYRNAGWEGSGSVPAAGDATTVSFVINEPSTLAWQWTKQFALEQSSAVVAPLNKTTWWDDGTAAETTLAPAAVDVDDEEYRFIEWQIDGTRAADATGGVAMNPAILLTMTNAVHAEAIYLPAAQDTDGNGLPDWWQLHYFGTLGVDPDADADGDGFTNRDEYLDGTDPTDPNDSPEPPTIAHHPLATLQSTPAPWLVEAVVTDNHAVTTVSLHVQRNDEAWGTIAMEPNPDEADTYGAIIEPGETGDAFSYYITATDPLGLEQQTDPFAFDVAYPLLDWQPEALAPFLLQPDTASNLVVEVANPGHAPLQWSLNRYDYPFVDDMEKDAGDWTTSGPSNHWHRTTQRAFTGEHAWYNGIPGTSQYTALMNAVLQTPPVTLHPDTNAALEFQHWMEADTVGAPTGYAWHGGIVEISLDDGATFEQLHPAGGYSHLMADFGDGSLPFPVDTPVYASTDGWETARFDLSAYAGETVVVQFRFGSDSFYNGSQEGWYIDDVQFRSRVPDDEPFWLVVEPTHGQVEPGDMLPVDLTVSADPQFSGKDQAARLVVESNAPVDSQRKIPVRLKIRTPPSVDVTAAAQTSTDGTGLVTIEAAAFNPDPEALDVEVAFSLDEGATWERAWISSAVSAFGSDPLVEPDDEPAQIRGVAVAQASGNMTNQLVITWNTQESPAMHLATNTWVQIRAWDGFYWSTPALSAPFLVDNEPPSAPGPPVSTTHTVGEWSRENQFEAEWAVADDGAGSGVAGYGAVLTATGAAVPQIVTTTESTFVVHAVPDGDDYQLGVRAIDHFGNIGEAVWLGPFRIDTTPPDPGDAVITITGSPLGNYTFATVLTNSWTGFQDNLSGIAGYYVALEDQGGTANGLYTEENEAILSNATPDAVNTVYVWAEDHAGNIGVAAAAEILVVGKEGRWHDSDLTNWEKEVAGIPVTEPDGAFTASLVPDLAGGGDQTTLRWRHAPGRRYTVHWTEGPLGPGAEWQTHILSETDYAVDNGNVIWIDPTPLAGHDPRYYRIEVELDE